MAESAGVVMAVTGELNASLTGPAYAIPQESGIFATRKLAPAMNPRTIETVSSPMLTIAPKEPAMLARHIIPVIGLSAAILSAGGVLVPAAHADSNCSDAISCLASFDDGNPGDNQGGDSGADRDRSDQKRDDK